MNNMNTHLPTARQMAAALRRAAVSLSRQTGASHARDERGAELLGAPTTAELDVLAAAVGVGEGQRARRAVYAAAMARRQEIIAAVGAFGRSPAGQAAREARAPAVARAKASWRRSLPAAEVAALDRDDLASLIRGAGYAVPRHGDLMITVKEGDPWVATKTEEEWHRYGRDGWRRRISGLSVQVTVPADYGQIPAAVRVVDGLVTLAATPIPRPEGAPEGAAFCSAIWIVQARGCDLRVEDGVIASLGDTAVHGGSWRSALATLRLRVGLPDPDATRRAEMDAARGARRLAREAARAPFRGALAPARAALEAGDWRGALSAAAEVLGADVAEIPVTRAHARAAGLCATGIGDWMARRDLTGRSIRLDALVRVVASSDDRRDLAVRAIEEALWRRYGTTFARQHTAAAK